MKKKLKLKKQPVKNFLSKIVLHLANRQLSLEDAWIPYDLFMELSKECGEKKKKNHLVLWSSIIYPWYKSYVRLSDHTGDLHDFEVEEDLACEEFRTFKMKEVTTKVEFT